MLLQLDEARLVPALTPWHGPSLRRGQLVRTGLVSWIHLDWVSIVYIYIFIYICVCIWYRDFPHQKKDAIQLSNHDNHDISSGLYKCFQRLSPVGWSKSHSLTIVHMNFTVNRALFPISPVPVQDMAHYVPQPTSMRHRDNSVGLGGIFEPGEVKWWKWGRDTGQPHQQLKVFFAGRINCTESNSQKALRTHYH
jgi:hypothetical protein